MITCRGGLVVVAVGLASGVACERRAVTNDAAGVEDGRPAGDGPTPRDGHTPADSPRTADGPPANQGPITFTVQNNRDAPVFIDNRYGDGYCFAWEIEIAGQWEERAFGGPGCNEECSAANRGNPCCMFCERPLPSVQQITPGGRFEFVWDAIEFQMVYTHCSDNCRCYRRVAPAAGHYRARICVSPAYACSDAPCPEPTEEGVIHGAELTEDRSCFETDFDIPYLDDAVLIAIDSAP